MDEQNNQVNMGSPMAPMPPARGAGAGPIIAILVILAIVALAGFYFWGERQMMETTTEEDASLLNIEAQSNSDETSSIESDLDNTDVETLDAEINAS